MGDKPCILISEPISTGRNYIDDAISRGYEPIVLEPWLDIPEESRNYMNWAEGGRYVGTIPEGTKVILGKENYEETLAEVKQYPIAAVVSGSEFGVVVVDRLAKDLGLLGNPVELSQSHRDKDLMQERLKEAGLRYIRGKRVKSLAEAEAFIDAEGLEQAVVKPVDAASSTGLHICDSKQETLDAIRESLGQVALFADTTKGLLIQERIVGTEYVVNTISCKGKHVISDVWEYRRVNLGVEGTIYDRVVLITELEPKHLELCEYALRVADAMGIEYGPVHGEYMLDEKGPVMIECGARPMGGSMPASFLDRALGHHVTDICMDAYLGPEAFEEFAAKPYRPLCHAMMKFLIASRDREIQDMPLNVIAQNLPSLHFSRLGALESASEIERTVDLETSPGTLYLTHEDEGVMMRDYEIILNLEESYQAVLYGLDDVGLQQLSDAHWSMADALTSKDAGAIGDSYSVVTTDAAHCDAEGFIDLKDPASFEGAVGTTACLHLSGSLRGMENFLRLFAQAVRTFKFEHIIVPEECYDHFPYGKLGLAQLLRLNGYTLELPKPTTRGLLVASRVWS